MTNPKENDIILNMLANPTFTVTDFLSVGLTGDNTELQDESVYMASEKIQNHEFFKDVNGNFDKAKFHKFYLGAGLFYNDLTTLNYELAVMDLALYSIDNIWAKPELKKLNYAPKLVKQNNQNLTTNSLDSIGKRGPRTKSVSEIAQALKIYDVKTGEWKDSPNDAFFDNFFDTLVLATYDEDVFDPITGKKIHNKGDYKLNEDGVPYYETLGGRDIYGKLVLNKMNVLTTDGSALNRFDFFDSDDIDEKSIGGSVLKLAALVGSMFIPYVGPVIRGLSVASQMSGLMATLGKIFIGNENETLNEILGWAKSVNRSALTEYAALNTWCVENLLNMVGDVVGQLAELRWIFKNAPYLVGNTKAAKSMTQKGADKLRASKLEELNGLVKTLDILDDLIKNGPAQHIEKAGIEDYIKGVKLLNEKRAASYVEELAKLAQNIGSPISKAYMVGLTVLDTYGEAKAAGASDVEAALLTLGYAATETVLLNTGVGEWILPELKGDKLKMKLIANALTKEVREASELLATDKVKKTWAQKVLDAGKKIATNYYAEAALLGKKGLPVIGAHAAGEAVEEVSEELLADVSKSVFNAVRWLRGEESLDLGAWENASDRYLMSAFGGFMGGGLSSFGTDFKSTLLLSKMNSTQAMLELIYMVNNNKEKDFLKLVDKMTFGDKNLSAKNIITSTNDGIVWAQASENDNQDLAIKKILHNEVDFIRNILESEGAKISTNSLLNRLAPDDLNTVLKEFRVANLQNATSMGLFVQNFQKLLQDLIDVHRELTLLDSSKTDSQDDTLELANRRTMLTEKLKTTKELLLGYLNGKMVPEAVRAAMYEMNPLISNNLVKIALPFFAKHKFGKEWEQLSDAEKESAKKQHKEYLETTAKNDIITGARLYHDMVELYTPTAEQIQQYILNLQKDEYLELKLLLEVIEAASQRLDVTLMDLANFDLDTYLADALSTLYDSGAAFSEALYLNFFSDSVKLLLNLYHLELSDIKTRQLDDTYTALDQQKDLLRKSFEYTNFLLDLSMQYVDTLVNKVVLLGHINPELRMAIVKSLEFLKNANINKFLNLLLYVSKLAESLGITDPMAVYLLQLQVMQQILLNEAILKQHINNVKLLLHTPILEYLNQFRLSTTNSDLNIEKHWESTMSLLLDNAEDIGMFSTDSTWDLNNEEALNLLDAFSAVINGMRTDNASFINPTGYTKIINEIYAKQGVPNYVKLAEMDSLVADFILLDINLIKDKLLFAKNLSALNKGQKLKLLEKVGITKTYLTYNSYVRLVNAVPDDWIGKDDLLLALNALQTLPTLAERDVRNLNSLQQEEIEKELLQLEDAVFKFFADNNIVGNSDKLSNIIEAFANKGGYFLNTGILLTENSKFIDDNAFIWWMAARASLKASSFYKVYHDSLDEKLAAIPSLELATYLGAAAVLNMDTLNTFVEAYQKSIVRMFNDLSESDKSKYLDLYKSGNGSYANELLKYFSGFSAVPQYKNMVFIEGIPGSGKSKGVFTSIVNIIKQIDPNYLKDAYYVHATLEAADEANQETGLSGKALDRKTFLQWISNEWKDTSNNIKTEVIKDSSGKEIAKLTGRFLYDDSYEISPEGRLINKWKINKYSDVPKVIFIDEITHYNQLELAMIEQFALENGIVVLTAGDLDLDTQIVYAKHGNHIFDFTMDRNSFIRTPKLGVSLRTLNKQMTLAIAVTQAAMLTIRLNLSVELNYNYLENDADHPGLFGVKVYNTLLLDDLTDEDLEQIKPTIENMINTATKPIGYIYHNPNSKLYKYLETNYKDKINFFKDSDALGLEGQYYIVENKRTYDGTTPSKIELEAYMRSVYTGISRSELGVLLIANNSYGNITNINSIPDNNFLLESITDALKKQSSLKRKQRLLTVLEDFQPEPLQIKPPTKHAPTQTSLPAGNLNNPLPPPILNPPIPEIINGGYTDINKAQQILNNLKLRLESLGEIDELIVKDSTDVGKKIKSLELESGDDNGILYWTPVIKLEDDSIITIQDLPRYTISKETSSNVAQLFPINQEIVVNENGITGNYRISNVTPDNGSFLYELTNLDDGLLITKTLDELSLIYVGLYEPEVEQEELVVVDSPLENINQEEVEQIIFNANATEDTNNVDGVTIKHRAYSFATLEMGVSENPSTKMPEFKGNLDLFNARIDNAIGLMKLPHFLGYTFLDLKNVLATIHGLVNSNLDNVSLARSLKNQLRLQGNVTFNYAIKSSAGNYHFTGNNAPYNRFHINDEVEKLEHIVSDTPKTAEIPKLKKLVLIVEENGKPVFELPCAILNSPITLLLMLENGVLVYPQENDTFFRVYNTIQNPYLAIKAVYDTYVNGPNLDLMNLCKLWMTTSNAIYYLKDNFNLATHSMNGPELLVRKGDYQVNDDLLYSHAFCDVEELAKDPRLFISSPMLSRDGKIGNSTVVRPGHSFVLISDNPNFQTDDDLYEQFEKLNSSGYTGKKEVSLFYIVPPATTVSDWLINLHNIYEMYAGRYTQNVADLGNDFTAYRILRALIDSGKYDLLQSSDDTKLLVFEAILQLRDIETKWLRPNLTFRDDLLRARYLELVTNYNEKIARQTLLIEELKLLLNTIPSWNPAAGTGAVRNKSLNKCLNSYLTGIVWFKNVGINTLVTYNESALLAIQSACEAQNVKSVYYKARYSTDKVGTFYKVETVPGNKWALYGINGNILQFRINSKVDTRRFSLDTLNLDIADMVRNITYNTNEMVYKTSGKLKSHERKYLNNAVPQNTTTFVDTIKSKYLTYFNNGELNSDILNNASITSEKDMLEALVKDYNRKVGNLGFIYNGKIYLTKLLDRDNTFKTSNFPITINNTDSIIFDIVDPNSGETREREISFSVDNSGNINLVECRCTAVTSIDLLSIEYEFTLGDALKLAVFNATVPKPDFVIPGFMTCKTSDDFKAWLELVLNYRNSGVIEIKAYMKDIEENLIPDKIKEEDYNKIEPILSGLLKKLKGIGTFELNLLDRLDIQGRIFEVTDIQGDNITINEVVNGIITPTSETLSIHDLVNRNVKKLEAECIKTNLNII